MGHDYGLNSKKTNLRKESGVLKAVKEFCKEFNQKIILKSLDGCISFGIVLRK